MTLAGVALAVGLVATAVIAGCAIQWGSGARFTPPVGQTGPSGEILAPVGTVFQFPHGPGLYFTVPAEGGILVGAASVDHTAVLAPLLTNTTYSCWMIPANNTYHGSAWSYSVNQTLEAGSYLWVAMCDGYANVTVTQAFELLPL